VPNGTINLELCHLNDCTLVAAKKSRRVIQDRKTRRPSPVRVINLDYTTIYAWRPVYGCIDHGAVVASLNAFATAAIIGRHGPLFHYRRKVAPVESEVSTAFSNFIRIGNCIFKWISTVASALRIQSIYNSI